MGAARLHEMSVTAHSATPTAFRLTSEEALQQAQAEGLTLVVADNKTGYYGVHHKPGQPKPYEAQVRRGGKMVSLGTFATVEEAALCVARFPDDNVEAWAQLILNDEVDGWC